MFKANVVTFFITFNKDNVCHCCMWKDGPFKLNCFLIVRRNYLTNI